MKKTMDQLQIAVLGATGYVGGRLVPLLLEKGFRVTAISRSAEKIMCRPYAGHKSLTVRAADVTDKKSLNKALDGCTHAFYLVHSMLPGVKDFSQKDKVAAKNMVAVSKEVDLEQIIYLGGLGKEGKDLSKHLKSRMEVDTILRSGDVPVTTLRAAMIMGSGSASFEILRYLVERLPVMITPRWVFTKNQPIAIRNVLEYLIGVVNNEKAIGKSFGICGPDVVTYKELFDIYSQEAGLRKRIIIPVPVLTPKLSSYWIHLVTPIPASLAQPLAEGLRNKVVCEDNAIHHIVPQDLLSCRETIRLAINTTEQHTTETCWSDAGSFIVPEFIACGDAPYSGGTVLDCSYRIVLESKPSEIWNALLSLGGERGWFFGNFLWSLRGLLDRLLGGFGRHRKRRVDSTIRVGDGFEFWRVIAADDNERLRLFAEMKSPGEAILEFEIRPIDKTTTELRQIARFLPRGLFGLFYWYSLYVAHIILFKGMLRGIAKSLQCKIIKQPEKVSWKEATCRLPQS